MNCVSCLLSPVTHPLQPVPRAGQLDASWEEVPDSNIPALESQAGVGKMPTSRWMKPGIALKPEAKVFPWPVRPPCHTHGHLNPSPTMECYPGVVLAPLLETLVSPGHPVSDTIARRAQFSLRGDSAPQGTLGNVRRHFRLSRLGKGRVPTASSG